MLQYGLVQKVGTEQMLWRGLAKYANERGADTTKDCVLGEGIASRNVDLSIFQLAAFHRGHDIKRNTQGAEIVTGSKRNVVCL